MNFEQHILRKLADGNFHSGQVLADQLGISRASIWNNVKKLQSYGLEVYSIRGKGYRIPKSTDVLDRELILQYLQQEISQQASQDTPEAASQPIPSIDLHWCLNSTNAYLLDSAHTAPAVCISEMQKKGRGRRGRQWVSPPGGNIYLSYKWQFNLGPSQLSALSLAVSVGVMRVLDRVGASDIGVKWPNDIVQKGRKLAGILLEMQGEANGPCTVVVGIGINVRISTEFAKQIDQAWVDLEQLSGKIIERSRLVAALVLELTQIFQLYEKKQLAPFIEEWLKSDQLKSKPVRIQMPQECYTGIAAGIDSHGNLIVDDNGVKRSFSGGEVSVRAYNNDVSMA